jgi:hypothetical protein
MKSINNIFRGLVDDFYFEWLPWLLEFGVNILIATVFLGVLALALWVFR